MCNYSVMDNCAEGPSTTKKQKIKDRGSLRKWSGAAIIVYIVCIAARAKNIYLPLHFVNGFCLLIVTVEEPQYFIIHKHVSLLETSISLIFLACLTRLHVIRLAALQTYFLKLLSSLLPPPPLPTHTHTHTHTHPHTLHSSFTDFLHSQFFLLPPSLPARSLCLAS